MPFHRSRLILPALTVALALTTSVAAMPAEAAPTQAGTGSGGGTGAPAEWFPTTIALPDGFRPEGIAIGAGPRPFAYLGSLGDGSIYRADLVSGQGQVISPGPGTPSVGLKLDRRGRLFVAGGVAGDARVVSASTGAVLATYQLAPAAFVNDVVLTPGAAWFTDSVNPVLYKLPLGRGGGLPGPDDVVTLPLAGEAVSPGAFNNGISLTPDGRGLLVAQSNTGLLFRVDPHTGATTRVDLGGQTLPNGDGILLQGRTLYVVQNQLNQVAVVRLDRTGTRGEVVERLTDPRFDVPTTVAAFGNRLYLPNARFTTPPTPTTPYTAVAIRRS